MNKFNTAFMTLKTTKFPENEFNKELGGSKSTLIALNGNVIPKYKSVSREQKHKKHKAKYDMVSNFKKINGYAIDFYRFTCDTCNSMEKGAYMFDYETNVCKKHIFEKKKEIGKTYSGTFA